MTVHALLHAITDLANHSVGTLASGDVLRRVGAALQGHAATDLATASTIAIRTAAGRIKIADGAASDDAASYGQLMAVAAGLDWQKPAAVLKVVSDANQGGVDPVGANIGDAYVVNNWGPGHNNGDLVELTSTGPDVWTVIVANVGGFVPLGTRLVVIGPVGSGLAAGSFALKETQIATANGAGAYTFTVPADGYAILINGEASVYENQGWVYDTNNWIQFIGATPNHNNLLGLQGGDAGAGEFYHLDSSQYAMASHLRPDVDLAGTEPVKLDMTGAGWVAGDRGIGIGTDGSIWEMYYNGVNGFAVQKGSTL